MEGTRTRCEVVLQIEMLLNDVFLRVWKEGFDQRAARKQNGFRFYQYIYILKDGAVDLSFFCLQSIPIYPNVVSQSVS